jgi:hypothetical protein
MKEQLLKCKKELEEIAGSWNGDESGSAEDMAHASIELIEQIEKLIGILEELNIN